jgi:digeranylgeranylglycerophospholipid reductase
MTHYDLIVVGGSFAGLIAAQTAAARGLKVAVLERKRDVGEGLRTTGIVVKEAAEVLDLPPHLVRNVPGVRLYPPSLKYTDHARPGYFFLATDTPGLLRWQAGEAAKAGVDIRLGARFTGAEEAAPGVVLKDHGISARMLIGADGGNSAVARHFGLDRNQRFLGGIEIELPPQPSVDGRFLHCFLDSKLAPGYIAWVVPGAGVTQAGLACRHGVRPDLDAAMAVFGHVFRWGRPEIVERRAGLIPCGGVLKRTYTNKVMLLGDAAGHCSPLTGGGIQLAWRLGGRAGGAVADYLENGGPSPGAVVAKDAPSYVFKGMMRRAADLGVPNWMWNMVFGSWAFRALAARVYFHGPEGKLEQTS